jgi:hypothetical protein
MGDPDRLPMSRTDHRPPHPLATVLSAAIDPHPSPSSAGDMLARNATHAFAVRTSEAAGDRLGADWDDDVLQSQHPNLGDEQSVVGDDACRRRWECGGGRCGG